MNVCLYVLLSNGVVAPQRYYPLEMIPVRLEPPSGARYRTFRDFVLQGFFTYRLNI